MGLADDVRAAGQGSLQDALHTLVDAVNTVAAKLGGRSSQHAGEDWAAATSADRTDATIDDLFADIREVWDYVDAVGLAEHLVGRGWHKECVVDAEIVEDDE